MSFITHIVVMSKFRVIAPPCRPSPPSLVPPIGVGEHSPPIENLKGKPCKREDHSIKWGDMVEGNGEDMIINVRRNEHGTYNLIAKKNLKGDYFLYIPIDSLNLSIY